MDRIRQILNGAKSKDSVNVDEFININLEGKTKLMPPGQINRVLDVAEQFDKERQSTTRYRIFGTITPIFSNVLFNISGHKGPTSFGDTANTFTIISQSPGFNGFGYETFEGNTFRKDPYGNVLRNSDDYNYEKSISKHLREVGGWFGFYNPDITESNLPQFFDLEPTRNKFDLGTATPPINWNITVTYPKAIKDDHHLVLGGLLITNARYRTVGGKPMVAFGTPVPHNLKAGNKVRLSNMQSPIMEGDYTVVTTGLDNGDSKETFFVVDINPDTATLTPSFTSGRMKRLYYGKEVTYYIRQFATAKSYSTQLPLEPNDYEIYETGFAKNAYGDPLYQIVFNEEIDVSGLEDNLGRPVSELYLTFIKKGASSDSTGTFTSIQSGFNMENYSGNVNTTTPEGLAVSNIRKMHTATATEAGFTSHTPIENGIPDNMTSFYGDIVEYSKYEAKETILQKISHRFNTLNRELTGPDSITVNASAATQSITIGGTRNEGYIYEPHYLMQIREFSNYVEQGDSTTVDIPTYAVNLGDGRFLWRDLLPIGYNDGQLTTLDYPYLNNSHYFYQNYCLVMKRQDPFGVFDLYYGDFPADIPGDGLPNDFIVRNADDPC